MELEYLSAAEIRKRALYHLKAKRDAKKQLFDPNEVLDKRYIAWIDGLIARHRDRGLLLTDQQLADFRAKRALRTGDAVRYVGPQRLEPVRGRNLLRPHGQQGTLTSVTLKSDGSLVYTFLPKIDPKMNDVDATVVQLVSTDWRLFERIPE